MYTRPRVPGDDDHHLARSPAARLLMTSRRAGRNKIVTASRPVVVLEDQRPSYRPGRHGRGDGPGVRRGAHSHPGAGCDISTILDDDSGPVLYRVGHVLRCSPVRAGSTRPRAAAGDSMPFVPLPRLCSATMLPPCRRPLRISRSWCSPSAAQMRKGSIGRPCRPLCPASRYEPPRATTRRERRLPPRDRISPSQTARTLPLTACTSSSTH